MIHGAGWEVESGKGHTKVLRHGISFKSERIELVGICSELLLDWSEGLVVDEEKNLLIRANESVKEISPRSDQNSIHAHSPISSPEGIQFGFCVVLKHLLGDPAGSNKAFHGMDGDVPQPLVFALEQKNHTGGLCVKGAGDMEDRFMDNALNRGIRDGTLSLKAVIGTAGFDQLKESGRGRVVEFGLN